MVMPTIQLSSRGLRKAPVKKTRTMCTTIEPTKMSAAQWCIWRISRPPRTSKERSTVERVGLGDALAVERQVACRGR